MVFFHQTAPFVDREVMINRDILWVTVTFGALALLFSIVSIIATFWLSYRERQDRYRQAIVANIDYLLKNLRSSFNDIGESIFYKNTLGLKRAMDSFDVYATLTLDELNPQFFASSHSQNEFQVYRKIMEEMTKNSLPLAIDRYNVMLNLSKNRLNLSEMQHDRETRERLTQHLTDFSQKIEQKKKLITVLNGHPKQTWIYTQKELSEFRSLLESIWANLIEAYKQYQKGLSTRQSTNWKGMEKMYDDQEAKFYQFRGTLQSLFII